METIGEPLSKRGAEMLFGIFSQHYERASTLVTSNLPFAEWTEVLGSHAQSGSWLGSIEVHSQTGLEPDFKGLRAFSWEDGRKNQ